MGDMILLILRQSDKQKQLSGRDGNALKLAVSGMVGSSKVTPMKPSELAPFMTLRGPYNEEMPMEIHVQYLLT